MHALRARSRREITASDASARRKAADGNDHSVPHAMTVVGLDVGTSGVKGIALDADGTVAARATRGYGLLTPQPGWAEQDPDDWWRAASEVLDELQARAGRPSGIGLSGQMHGLVALDRADRPLRPAILWNDQRSQAECEGDRGSDRARAADRADGEPRAHRLHRPEAAVAAQPRTADL